MENKTSEIVETKVEPDRRTPKQKYDEEMKSINSTIAPDSLEGDAGLSKQDIKDLDEEVEAVEQAMDAVHDADDEEPYTEKEIDKSMGDTKVPATSTMNRSQHLDLKIEEQRKAVLSQFNGGFKKEKLTKHQQKVMDKVLNLSAKDKINDPVLVHLINKKLDLAAEQAILSTKIKEMQLQLIEQMRVLSDDAFKNAAGTEHYNRDILLYIQKNPKLIEVAK